MVGRRLRRHHARRLRPRRPPQRDPGLLAHTPLSSRALRGLGKKECVRLPRDERRALRRRRRAARLGADAVAPDCLWPGRRPALGEGDPRPRPGRRILRPGHDHGCLVETRRRRFNGPRSRRRRLRGPRRRHRRRRSRPSPRGCAPDDDVGVGDDGDVGVGDDGDDGDSSRDLLLLLQRDVVLEQRNPLQGRPLPLRRRRPVLGL
mmetsp:Transcript_30428/g.98087  ORF Transcript_30428/g.98087 Transcript_30428/m.98087 type:complete len:205 (-) Transcript_30428:632-1246(-)